MRPAGEVRVALRDAAQVLAQEQGGATWRDMAVQACVCWDTARATVKNMVARGELAPVGLVRVPRARRPMVRYAPAEQPGAVTAAGALGAPLAGVLQTWMR